MVFNYRAPDGALIEVTGTTDLNAPSVQILLTPTSGTPVSFASTYGGAWLPQRWEITAELETPAPDRADFSKTLDRLAAAGYDPKNLTTTTPEEQKSLAQVFTDGVAGTFGSWKFNIQMVGVWVVIVLVLILLIQRGNK